MSSNHNNPPSALSSLSPTTSATAVRPTSSSPPKMTSVKQLMAKFSTGPATTNGGGKNGSTNNAANGGSFSPVKFEEQKKQARQRELEEIRLAKEKAKLYNATLRAKSIQIAKEQSTRTRTGLASGLGGSTRSFQFESSPNPQFGGGGGGEVPGAAPHRDGSLIERLEESFEGKTEEKKDIVPEMACPPTHSTFRFSLKASNPPPAVLVIEEPTSTAIRTSRGSDLGNNNKRTSAGARGSDLGNKAATQPAPIASVAVASRTSMKSPTTLASVASMTDVTPKLMLAAADDDDDLSRTHSMLSMQGIPDGGYDEIHEAVRFNRPSVSDLLLRPTLGERNYSVSSVGPMVEQPSEEPCRLLSGVDIKTVLYTFYQTYAPEKLEDLDLVLRHFKGRTEALLFTLECKYFVTISADGLVTPYRPSDAPPEAEHIEDERQAARRSTMLSTATDMTDFTTDSYKGYVPSDMRDGGLPSTLANSWAVKPKHDSGKREGRKTALMMKKVGSDLL